MRVNWTMESPPIGVEFDMFIELPGRDRRYERSMYPHRPAKWLNKWIDGVMRRRGATVEYRWEEGHE